MTMNNIEFLTHIDSVICKIDNKYYISIPFASYDSENTYVQNFNNQLFILIDDNLINGNDLEEFISILDDRYTYYTNYDNYEKIYSHNYSYYNKLNYFADKDITEEEMLNTNVAFMNILKETFRYENPEVSDYIYKYVIDYYANGQYDDAIILMNTIFNTQLTTSKESCGCNQQNSNCSSVLNTSNLINTGTELISYDNATCLEKYKAAMYIWLQKMLSDTEFYCNWLFIENDDEYVPNEPILNKLIDLLTFLLNSNVDLSNLGNSNKSRCSHSSSNKCDDLNSSYDTDNSNLCNNYGIIQNYIKLLEYVKENKIEENRNKIYIYGKKFAEIFPLLNF